MKKFLADLLKKGPSGAVASWKENHLLKKEIARVNELSFIGSNTSPDHDIFIKAMQTENWTILNHLLKKYGPERLREEFVENGEYRNLSINCPIPLLGMLTPYRCFEWIFDNVGLTADQEALNSHLEDLVIITDIDTPESIANRLKLIEFCVQKGADLDFKDEDGLSLFYLAVAGGWKVKPAEGGEKKQYHRFDKDWVLDRRCGPVQVVQLLQKLGAKEPEIVNPLTEASLREEMLFKLRSAARTPIDPDKLGEWITNRHSIPGKPQDPPALKENIREEWWAEKYLFPDTLEKVYGIKTDNPLQQKPNRPFNP